MAFFEVKNVSKDYSDEFRGIKSISVSQKKHRRVAIIGETGSGKSTLLKIMSGLLQPDKGKVLLNGEQVPGPDEQLIAGHPDIAYLSQENKLPKFISVQEYLYDKYEMSEKEAEMVYRACRVGQFLDKDTSALSGGERQRVALAKKLLDKPDLLLLDEPFSNLDFIHKNIIKETLQDIQKELNTTVVLVAHDGPDVLGWAEEIIVLKAGKVVQIGTPYEIYYQPKSLYVAGLTGIINEIPTDDWNLNNTKAFVNYRRKMLVRPELLVPVNKGINGVVRNTIFNGSYSDYEFESTGGTTYIFRAESGAYQVGQKLQLGIKHPPV